MASSSSSGCRVADALFQAALTGNLDLFKSLANQMKEGFSKGVSSERDSSGLTVLHYAALGGRTHIIRFLVEEGKLDVNLEDLKIGVTPLHLAILNEHFLTAVYLLERGANPNAATIKGRTPLHHAAEKGPKKLVKFLISKGANINAMADCGTPLQMAAGRGQKEIVKVLLAHNADANIISSNDQFSPLLASVLAGSIDCLKVLLEAGANPNICGIRRVTPLGSAADEGDTEMIKCLLRAGADANITNNRGLTPIEEAALINSHEAVTILFPVTFRIPGVQEWSVPGLFKHVHSNEAEEERKQKAKERFLFAKSKGTEAFEQKEYFCAIQWYTEANFFDPTNAAVLSDRSLCWLHLNEISHALEDAGVCVGLRPDWSKGYYRAGSAYMQLKEYKKAADIFLQGLKLDRQNKEIERAFREAIDALRNSI